MRAADARKACPEITLVHVETISEGTEERGKLAQRGTGTGERYGARMGFWRFRDAAYCQVSRFGSGHI